MATNRGHIKNSWEKLEESRIRFKKQMEEIKRIREERQVLIKILSMKVSKEEIRKIIRESLASGSTREKKKIRFKKRTTRRMKVSGDRVNNGEQARESKKKTEVRKRRTRSSERRRSSLAPTNRGSKGDNMWMGAEKEKDDGEVGSNTSRATRALT